MRTRLTTDEDIIKWVEQNAASRRNARPFMLIGGISLLIFLLWFASQVLLHKVSQPGLGEGFFDGVVFGFLSVFLGSLAAVLICKGLIGLQREFPLEKLLLRISRENKELKQALSNHTSEGIRQPANGSPKPSM